MTERLTRLWHQIPALIRGVIAGLVVAQVAVGPWDFLVRTNMAYAPAVPWATAVMAVLLVAWWHYFVRGRGWPAATGRARQASARANSVPEHLWGPALGAGVLGLTGVLLLQGVMGRLISLPQQQELDPSQYSPVTVIAWVLMGVVVSGVVEETSFRGYMQSGIERRHGPIVAIVVSGCVFAVAHFRHPEVGMMLVPYYVAVSAVYGGLAYATNSTFPSMLLHAGGNAFSALGLFTQGRSEWQLGSTQPALVWQSGVDSAFLVNLVALVVVALATVAAYRGLAAMGREAIDMPSSAAP
jgi:membrane protease YdiL (CAAX protease family)